MGFKNFVSGHVHVRSLDSVGSPKAFAENEKQLGTGHLVITDHGTLEGCRQVYDLCNKEYKGILKPILGIEAYFRDDECPILQDMGVEKTPLEKKNPNGPKGYKDHVKYMHVTLHAQDENAFYALTEKLSLADDRAERHGSERKALFDWKVLEELGAQNMTGTSGCLIGMLGRHLVQNNDFDAAIRYYEKLRSCFKPGNFYVELMPHVCDRDWKQAVVFNFEDGTQTEVPVWRKVKTMDGEYQAKELAEHFLKDPQIVWKKHVLVNEMMIDRAWRPVNSTKIKSIVLKEGYIKNECRPWAEDGDVQLGLNKLLLDLAKKHGDPILITDDAHFPTADYKEAQDIRLGQHGSWRFPNSHHRMTSQAAWEYFSTKMNMSEKDFGDLVEGTYQWAAKFDDFKFTPRQTLPTKFYPQDTLKHTMNMIQAKGRMKWDDPVYTKRLEDEIRLLHNNGKIDLLTYFFIDEEVCTAYARNGLLTGPGRGSAAGMLTTYLLGITHLDPIKWGLSKDRFLTLDRIESGKMPDIDQDLESTEFLVGEDGTAGWLKGRFGDCVAQIGTDVCMHLPNAIRDTFRAKEGFVSSEVEAFCKKLPKPPQGIPDSDFLYGYESADGEQEPGLLETSKELQDFVKKYPQHWACIEILLGNPRGRGRHPCGRVIANEPIYKFMPMTEVGGVKVTQFNAAGVEAMGALKMDFLRVNNLKFISDAVKLIQDRHGRGVDWSASRQSDSVAGEDRAVPQINGIDMVRAVPFGDTTYDIYNLPNDPKIIATLVSGDTKGVFQLDTDGARKWIRSFDFDVDKETGAKGLSTVEDLATFVALDRPGPLKAEIVHADGSKNNMLVEYARRVQGIRDSSEIPVLMELLPETKGIIIFQEQMAKIFQYFTECSGAEAENFRGLAAKKKKKEMSNIYPRFMEMASRKTDADTAQKLWDQMITFAEYGFCIDGDQLVSTETGPVKMSEITTKHRVATWTGTDVVYENPVHVWQSGEKEVLDVRVENIGQIAATADHRFLYEGEWVTLNDVIPLNCIESLSRNETDQLAFKKQKILSATPLGKRPVYDMEMPSHNNFVLDGGVVAHNCKAHSAAYATLSYTCAWLRYHYPLEWWVSVLSNIDRDDVNEKFWRSVSQFMLLPDVSKTNSGFVIEGDKIRAPLSMLSGLGDAAFKQLGEMGPYKDIADLMQKIENYKLVGATATVTETKSGKKKVKYTNKKRSPLGSVIVSKMIVAGVCDSLFPATDANGLPLSTAERLALFAEAEAKVLEQKTPNNYAANFALGNKVLQYQTRRSILTSYEYPIIPMMRDAMPQRIKMQKEKPVISRMFKDKEVFFPLFDGEAAEQLENIPMGIPGGFTYCVLGYVIDDKKAMYTDKKTGQERTRCVLKLDLDGYRKEQLVWPDDAGDLPKSIQGDVDGALVACYYFKSANGKTYFNDVEVLSPPLKRMVKTDEHDE